MFSKQVQEAGAKVARRLRQSSHLLLNGYKASDHLIKQLLYKSEMPDCIIALHARGIYVGAATTNISDVTDGIPIQRGTIYPITIDNLI